MAQQPNLDKWIGCLVVPHSAPCTIRHPLLVRLISPSQRPLPKKLKLNSVAFSPRANHTATQHKTNTRDEHPCR